MRINNPVFLLLLSLGIAFSACKKNSMSSTLRVLVSPSGQHQSISANLNPQTGYFNFNPQQLMADGGNPFQSYKWSIVQGSGAPVSLSLSQYGVVNWNGGNSAGTLTPGTHTFKVEVSDGSSTKTGDIDFIVTNDQYNPLALFQQLGTPFTLVEAASGKSYGASLYALGGTPPYRWQLDSSYPGSADLSAAGLVLDADAGIVRSAKCNTSASGKTIKFKVVLTDSKGDIAGGASTYTIQVK